MKYAIVLILLLTMAIPTKEAPGNKLELIVLPVMADFRETYKQIRKNEGNYANLPYDKGRETYGGITSTYNPDWYGWRYIKGKTLKNNERVEEAEYWVLDFYLDIWVKEGFYKLKNQAVADYLFDTRVHTSRKQTIKLINRAYNLNLKFKRLTKEEIEWVQPSFDTLDLEQFKVTRIKYYNKLIAKDSTQESFRKAWMRRANN